MSYANTPSFPIETKVGKVVKANRGYFWIPSSVEETFTDGGELVEHEDVVELPTNGGYYGSRRSICAELWAVLAERFAEYEASDARTIEPDRELLNLKDTDGDEYGVRVPVVIARENKPVIAAYLRAHGFDTTWIKSWLDVSESTVDQYISDVLRGER